MLDTQLKGQVRSVIRVTLILSAVLGIILCITGFIFKFSVIKALLGVCLGTFGAAASFFILALNVQYSVEQSERVAQISMGTGYIVRLVVVAVVVILAIKLPSVFNVWATIIPFIFPHFSIFILNFAKKGGDKT